jgi:hypothetical protein
MARRTPVVASAAILLGVLIAPAAAQFGSIFGEPPRPPGTVPGGRQSMPTPPSYPSQSDYPQQGAYPPPQDAYPPQQGAYPPSRSGYPPPGNYPPQNGPGGVQSRPLPPPQQATPGSAAIDPAPRAPVTPRQRGPQPADTSPQPGDEVITEPPSQRIANKAALFSGLDKITGRIINFDVAIGETVQFGALQLTPRACYTRPATETSNTDSFIEVDEVTLQGEVRRIFTGWVFAASPGLHAVEHPIYDIWLTDCKNPVVTAEQPAPVAPPATAAAPPPQQKARPPQQKARPQQQQPQGYPPYR